MKQCAVYTILKPLHEDIDSLLTEVKKIQGQLDDIYRLSKHFEPIQDYMDENMDQDEIEYIAHHMKDKIEEIEKEMERKYNQWKFTFYGDELFTLLDNSIFEVSRITLENEQS